MDYSVSLTLYRQKRLTLDEMMAKIDEYTKMLTEEKKLPSLSIGRVFPDAVAKEVVNIVIERKDEKDLKNPLVVKYLCWGNILKETIITAGKTNMEESKRIYLYSMYFWLLRKKYIASLSPLQVYISMAETDQPTFARIKQALFKKIIPVSKEEIYTLTDKIFSLASSNFGHYLNLFTFFTPDLHYTLRKVSRGSPKGEGKEKYSPLVYFFQAIELQRKQGPLLPEVNESQDEKLCKEMNNFAEECLRNPEKKIEGKEIDRLYDFFGEAVYLDCPRATFVAYMLARAFGTSPALLGAIDRLEFKFIPENSGCVVLFLLDDSMINKLQASNSVTYLRRKKACLSSKYLSLISDVNVQINNTIMRQLFMNTSPS